MMNTEYNNKDKFKHTKQKYNKYKGTHKWVVKHTNK